jgi:hypothetical protein
MSKDNLILYYNLRSVLRWVDGGFSSRRLGFNPGWIRVRFVVAEVALQQVFPPSFSGFPTRIIIPPFLHHLRCSAALTKQHIIIHSVSIFVVLSPTQRIDDYWVRKLVRILNYVVGDTGTVLWDRMQSLGRQSSQVVIASLHSFHTP